MGQFLEREKIRQAGLKSVSPYFFESGLVEGLYKGKLRPFCLPIESAEQNLFPEIRDIAISHFSKHDIK